MKIDFGFLLECFRELWKAVPLTLELTSLSYILGFFVALAFALTLKHKVKILSPIVSGILSVLRGTPAILQLYIVYYAIPLIIKAIAQTFNSDFNPGDVPNILLVVIALGFNRAAYLTATITSGLNAINYGEVEAGLTIGMTQFQVLKTVIIPATVKVSLRNLSTNLINLLHMTSLAMYATLIEVMNKSQLLCDENWKFFEAYVAAGLVYWILTIVIEVSTHYADKYFHRYERRA